MKPRIETKPTTARGAISAGLQVKNLMKAAKTAAVLNIAPLALAPDSGMDVWISARQASQILNVTPKAVYRLSDPAQPHLLSKRPLPRKVLISLRSVTALAEATKDAEFWTSPELQAQHREKLKRIAGELGLKMVG